MSHKEHERITSAEIKKEFQLERMILFSDAVFAVVITLMAMEIKLPEGMDSITVQTLPALAWHLLPVIFSYTVSYVFIGSIWYEHLKIFALLKSYDKGLVVRNLVVLFFVGLFPFGASVIAHGTDYSVWPFVIYTVIVLCCIGAQFALHHYILVNRPQLRNHLHIADEIKQLNERKPVLLLFPLTLIAVLVTWCLIPEKNFKPFSMLWLAILPVVLKLLKRKKKAVERGKHKAAEVTDIPGKE